MKIMVTGGLGFIGSAVVQKALNDGINVLNVDKKTYAANLGMSYEFQQYQNYQELVLDIQDVKDLPKKIEHFKPDYIMHLAAESHVDNSIAEPDNFIKTNILGTYNLINITQNLIHQRKLSENFKFLHVSTDEVYGSLGPEGSFDSSSNIRPNSPYSASKASSDLLVRSWYKTFGFPGLITHCSNNYGPKQGYEKLIPKVVQCFHQSKKFSLYGSGENVRDWIHVDDHVAGLFLALFKGLPGKVYNFGGNCELSNNEIIKKIASIMTVKMGYSNLEYLVEKVEDRLGHDFRYSIDNKEVKKSLGWEPKVFFDHGLLSTLQWFHSQLSEKV